MDEQILNSNDDLANVSVRFIAGTAFLGKIAIYEADGANAQEVGLFGVGGHWQHSLPVNSHFRVRVPGFFYELCWYFDVIRPTSAKVHFWGSLSDPRYSIQGDGIHLGIMTAGFWRCPVPDYQPN